MVALLPSIAAEENAYRGEVSSVVGIRSSNLNIKKGGN